MIREKGIDIMTLDEFINSEVTMLLNFRNHGLEIEKKFGDEVEKNQEFWRWKKDYEGWFDWTLREAKEDFLKQVGLVKEKGSVE